MKKLVNYQEPQKSVSKFAPSVDSIFKEIQQVHNANYHQELRKDLLGSDSLRLRKGGGTTPGDDMGKAMKHFADIQERIAENMISLTSSLKEQTQTANRIIKNDVETVKRSTVLSESNFGSLKTKSEKLKEHSNRACKCWIWMMIGCVMMIFMCKCRKPHIFSIGTISNGFFFLFFPVMVFFIKVMKK